MKFRNNRNQLLFANLFIEFATDKTQAIYSINRESFDDYVSLYQLYLDEEDFTEFEFANKHLESYQHWKALCEKTFFIPHIAQWREELQLKVQARTLKSLIDKSTKDSNVAKYLLTNKWIDRAQENIPVTNLRGRPSKEEIKQHLTLITNEQKEIENDYERIKEYV